MSEELASLLEDLRTRVSALEAQVSILQELMGINAAVEQSAVQQDIVESQVIDIDLEIEDDFPPTDSDYEEQAIPSSEEAFVSSPVAAPQTTDESVSTAIPEGEPVAKVEEPSDPIVADIAVIETDDLPEPAAAPVKDLEIPEEQMEDLVMELETAADIPQQTAIPPQPEVQPEASTSVPQGWGKSAESDKAPKPLAVLDSAAIKAAWRTDIPGGAVKDIRSAISLNDRVLFIGRLFREDSLLFQDTVAQLNAKSSLDEAVAFLAETFPEWKWEGDDVYRFMMAVRRKLK